jgi:WXG100 family type VII secretion target
VTEYEFNFGQADQVRDHMATITNRIHTMLDDLHRDVSSSLAGWESAARDEYNLAKTEWDAASGRMPAALGRAEQTLASISDGYLRVEHYGIDLWRR